MFPTVTGRGQESQFPSAFCLLPSAFLVKIDEGLIFSPSKSLSQTPSNGRNNAVPQVGCLSGYGNDTYNGSRPVTRYEFAAGLNGCLNHLNQVIPANRANLATKEDLEILLQRQRQLNQQRK